MLGLAAYIRRHRIEILHATDRPRDAIACVVLAALTGAKALIHAHVNYGDWMGRGVNWALGRADAIVGVSNRTACMRFSTLSNLHVGTPRWTLPRDGHRWGCPMVHRSS
jgi:hypothetical protein